MRWKEMRRWPFQLHPEGMVSFLEYSTRADCEETTRLVSIKQFQHHLSLIMTDLPHCFALHNVQKVRVDKLKKVLVFETECPNGSVYYFQMSRDQFFSFNDILPIIDLNDRPYNFPLGKEMWCRYTSNHNMIFYYCQKNVPYFKFENYYQYKNTTHRRLLSFLRHDGKQAVGLRRSGGEDGGFFPSNCKRPLSIAMQPSDQSARRSLPASDGEDVQASSRSPNNVVMSLDDKTSAILSERLNPNPRRENDSCSVLSSICENPSSPENIELGYSSDTMDYE